MEIIKNKNIKIKSQIAQTSKNNNKDNQNKKKRNWMGGDHKTF